MSLSIFLEVKSIQLTKLKFILKTTFKNNVMMIEEVLELVEQILDCQSLNKVQEIVFRQAWEGKSYTEIATSISYEPEYIKQVGFELWRSLSLKLEKKVTKNNFQHILKRYVLQAQVVATIPAKPSNQNELEECDRPKTLLNLEKAIALTAVATPSFFERPRQDWGDALDVSTFHGRDAELQDLEQWIVGDRSRLVTIFGQEGVGKTALSAKVAERIQEHFDYIIWRNLRNAPAIPELLNVLIQFFSNQATMCLPTSVDEKIYLLLNQLRFSRCLIVLDNAESILQKGEFAEQYRPGYEGYGQLFRCVAQTNHQSCLMLTSRQNLKWLEAREGEQSRMRSLSLNGSVAKS